MRSYEEMAHNPTSERLVNILCESEEENEKLFFRILVGYYFATMASMMRCSIKSFERGNLPVNVYSVPLGPSGFGKTKATNTMEDSVVDQFRKIFMEQTFEISAMDNLAKIGHKRAVVNGTDPDDELKRVTKTFKELGPLPYSFDSATAAGIKETRYKLLLAKAGALNFQMDEVGLNLGANLEAMHTYLELYDVGRIKLKLMKNTKDNLRPEDLKGDTPTNALLFGVPTRLLDGGKTEEEFMELLDTGYARRCFFAYVKGASKRKDMSVEAFWDRINSVDSNDFLEEISDDFGMLADPVNLHKELVMSEDVAKLFIEYRLKGEREASELPEHEEIRKAEMAHRYFKAMKLAGAYAFVENSPQITEEHAYQAIKVAGESGDAFAQVMNREKPYQKLARYIAEVGQQVTQADLVNELPYYKGSKPAKDEMMQLAIAHGYQNNIIIKREFNDGIEFISGETLQRTNLDRLVVSYSHDVAVGYQNEHAPWDQLHKLTQAQGMHWVNHHLKGGHRQEDNAEVGFNLIVIDVDDGVTLDMAKNLLQDYQALFYTTKRHTPQENRFRIILPTNYYLKMDAKDYKEFMSNIFEWLPFEVDDGTGQRARKWLSHSGHHEYQDGELFDVLPFIPKTSKNEKRKQVIDSQQSLDNLERWFVNNTGDGNRNKQMHRYAMLLVDAGFDFEAIRQKVISLNDKLPDNLPEAELMSTVMVTVGRALAPKQTA